MSIMVAPKVFPTIKMELDMETSGIWAVLIKNSSMDRHAINC
jgi:hypothetical protein